MSTTTTSKSASAAQFVFSPPNSFDFQNPSSWERWLQRFERYRIVSRLNLQPSETQVATLIYCLGEKAEDIISASSLSKDDQKDYKKVKSMFQDHFTQTKNIIYERAKFNLRTQHENEPFGAFVFDLCKLSKKCDFGNLREEMIRDRIVIGIRDKQLSQFLQLDAELTLGKAVKRCRQREKINRQQNDIETAGSTAEIGSAINELVNEKELKSSAAVTEEISEESETSLSETEKIPPHNFTTVHQTVTQTTSSWKKNTELVPTVSKSMTIQQGTPAYHSTPVSSSTPFEGDVTTNINIRQLHNNLPVSSPSDYNHVITCPDCHTRQTVSLWRIYAHGTHYNGLQLVYCYICCCWLYVYLTKNNNLVVEKCRRF